MKKHPLKNLVISRQTLRNLVTGGAGTGPLPPTYSFCQTEGGGCNTASCGCATTGCGGGTGGTGIPSQLLCTVTTY